MHIQENCGEMQSKEHIVDKYLWMQLQVQYLQLFQMKLTKINFIQIIQIISSFDKWEKMSFNGSWFNNILLFIVDDSFGIDLKVIHSFAVI
jgi:hypothetical protein